MHAYIAPTPQERFISGAGAFGMHLLFVALLVFGVNWQKKVEPQANVVDLWTSLQPETEAAPPPPPPPPPPEPEVQPKVQPVEPPKAVVKPEIAKPDIALKDKATKDRRVIEEKKKEKEAKKPVEDSQAAQKQQQAKEAEAQRRAELEQAEAQRKMLEQQAAARKTQMDRYKAAIRDKIKRFIVLPPNMQGNPEAEFDVVQLPGGEVLGVKLKRGSGNTAYDNAVERAILKSQPLPLPPDPTLFTRELNLTFRPQE